MKTFLTSLSAASVLALTAGAAFAGPPAGVPVGPPAGIPMGPPAGVPTGPPAGIPHGPPAGITAGPPSAATSHIPEGVTMGAQGDVGASAANHASDTGAAASLLKQLNAGHASDTGLAHASSKSIVGAIGAYKTATLSAQADVSAYTVKVQEDQTSVDAAQTAYDAVDPTDTTALADAQATLDAAKAQLAADQASLDAANLAVTDAQTQLSSSTNVTLTPEVVGKLDNLLGIPTT